MELVFMCGHAGTAMRFLTAFLARVVGKWELTGSERMKPTAHRSAGRCFESIGGAYRLS